MIKKDENNSFFPQKEINFKFLVFLIISIYFLFFIFQPYIQVEILTRNNKDKVEIFENICSQKMADQKLKSLKILNLDSRTSQAQFYCLYENPANNLKIRVVFRKDWEVIYVQKINAETFFYWPVYL